MQATLKDLRLYSKELPDAVSRGEEVIITYRGKALAKIVPFVPALQPDKNGHKLFGMWSDNKKAKNVDEYVRNLRKGVFPC